MANNFITSDLISKEAAIHWKNMDTFLATSNRRYSQMWGGNTYDPGDTINIRLDNQFEVKRGDTVTPSAIDERNLPLTLEPLYSVPVEYTTVELTTDLFQGWSERVLRPAVRNIVSRINYDIANRGLTQVYHSVGNGASNINTFAAVEEPGTIMQELGVPLDERWYFAMTPKDGSALKSSLQNSFNDRLNRDISDRSALGYLSYFDMYFDQGINRQAVQNKGAVTFAVTSNVSSGATSISVTGSGAFSVNAGETFSVTGVQSVNHINKTDTGRTMDFVVTQSTTSAAAVQVLQVAPAIYGPERKPLQNVSALPAAGDVILFNNRGTGAEPTQYKVNYAYGENALHVVTPPLAPLDVPESSVFNDGDTGISLRVSKSGEILNNKNIMRLDVLCGYRWIGEQAVRYHSLV